MNKLTYDKNGFMKSGVYDNLPENIYHQGPEISNSKLKTYSENADAYHREFIKKETVEKIISNEMDLGSYVHALILTPNNAKEYITQVKGAKTDSGIAERSGARNDGYYPVNQDEYDAAQRMRDSAMANELMKTILKHGKPEVSLFGQHPETELKVRARTDWIDSAIGWILDIKTTHDIHPDAVAKKILQNRWHVQEAIYTDIANQHGYEIEDFYWAVIQSKPPYHFIIRPLSNQLREYGKEVYENDMKNLKHSIDHNDWPLYNYDQIEAFEIPRY